MRIEAEVPALLLPFGTEKRRYKLAQGGRGGAKSWSFALLLAGFMSRLPVRVLCAREIQRSIKESVHHLIADTIHRHQLPYFNVTENTIRNTYTGGEFIFHGLRDMRSNLAGLQGVEGVDYCWVEEAQSVTKASLDVLLPTIRKEGSEIWASYNLWSASDPIHRLLWRPEREDTLCVKVNYTDNPFCPEVLKAEAARCREDSPEDYEHIWLGEPRGQHSDSILNRVMVRAAMDRAVPAEGGVVVGADIARFGDDRIVFYKRQGMRVVDSYAAQGLPLTETADRLMAFAGREAVINIDDSGVGGGVTDILRAQGYNATGINFGGSPSDKGKYNNWISENWFYLRSVLNEAQIPNDDELFEELTNRLYTYDKAERRCIESKADYKKRGYRSPDKADALILCFHNASRPFEDMVITQDVEYLYERRH